MYHVVVASACLHGSHNSSSQIGQRDARKRMICERDGISLIVIPYWWNMTVENVAHAISATRPDIVLPASLLTGRGAIPKEPPKLDMKRK